MTDMSDLIKKAEEISARTELPYERRLVDTAVWFIKNKDRIPREDLPKRCDFLEKTLEITLELFALSLDRQHKIEGRSQSLWLPNGMKVSGDLTRFG